jgi:hypothetical protein
MEQEKRENIAKEITGSLMDASDLREQLTIIRDSYAHYWLSANTEEYTNKIELREQLYLLNTMIKQLK